MSSENVEQRNAPPLGEGMQTDQQLRSPEEARGWREGNDDTTRDSWGTMKVVHRRAPFRRQHQHAYLICDRTNKASRGQHGVVIWHG